MLLVIQNQPASDQPRRVFVSYSHQDEEWKGRIMEALKPLEQQQRIAAWHDRKLLPGEAWDGRIKHELNQADVILFLVSPAFIGSPYCREVEVRRAVERSDAGEAVLVPIIVRRCEFQKEPFARFQTYPIDGSPLDESPDQAARLTDLQEKLHLALLGWWYPRRPRGNGGSHGLWQLQFRPAPSSPPPSDQALLCKLRELASDQDILPCGRAQDQSIGGKVVETAPILLLDGPAPAFATLERLNGEGRLSAELGVEVLSFKLVLGATMQASSEVVDSPPDLLEQHENLLLTPSPHDTPDVPQMLVVRDEDPGWMLVMPSRIESATPKAVFQEVQALFTTYLGTMLAVPDGRLTVNLSTYEPDDTLLPSLRRTQLGHDLIEQDCMLKQYAASLLHPDTATGRAYWQALTAEARQIFGKDQVPLRVFQKVWVVPGDENSVHEKTPKGPWGFAWPERFGVRETDRACSVTSCKLAVLCEADYVAMEHHRPPEVAPEDALGAKMNEISVSLFRELLLPAIVTEVNEGTHFTKLRQIYYAFNLAIWFRRSLKDNPAYAPVFSVIDNGLPETFGVQRSDDWEVKNEAVYRRYLGLFQQGVFRCARPAGEGIENRARIFFSGGVVLEERKSRSVRVR